MVLYLNTPFCGLGVRFEGFSASLVPLCFERDPPRTQSMKRGILAAQPSKRTREGYACGRNRSNEVGLGLHLRQWANLDKSGFVTTLKFPSEEIDH
ncbi:hypothetical protein Nepgr_030795 [Nepenthes gracilis]|uniref:Uncharacterized protein n=1 Tax=Nepenthes gracilis TaxID=150966 RepID=A0AAD3THN1_NEPGR|nr:hypothetical protein Nepgr_030795 [Nepenthes gracilis]